MHYFALRANDVAIKELLQVGGCMCIRNNAGQSAIDVRRTQELRMPDAQLPVYKQAVQRHRASFTVIAFAIFYAGHGEDNYKIFKSFLAPED